MSATPQSAGAASRGLTRALAAHVAGLRAERLPERVRAQARSAIADCLGGALAGAHEPVTAIAAAQLGGAQGACTLWGRAERAGVADAALINGCAAHAHALDDTHESMRGHPSAPIVPAVLALAELLGASGEDIVTAYVAGVDVAARLGRSVNDRHAQVGWHTTGTLGSVGAAAACAHLLRLDAPQCAQALGLASSMAGGLRVNFGTMAKALHAGLAAQHGVMAARLVAGGMTASAEALEGHEGFLALFCDDGSHAAARALQGLGTQFEVETPGIVYKQYPTCSLMHALIDMVLEARVAGAFAPGAELRLRCGISQRLEAARRQSWPAAGMEAKFHVEYCVAVAAWAGTQGIGDFTDAALQRAPVRALAERVEIALGADFPPGNGDYAALQVLRDGAPVFEARRAKALGHPSMPLTAAQHEAKFMGLAARSHAPERAAALWQALATLERGTAAELSGLLAAACAAAPGR